MQGREAVTISALENSLWLLPGELRNTLRHLPEKSASEVCEIRLRRGRLPAVTLPDGEHPLLDTSAVTAAGLSAPRLHYGGGRCPCWFLRAVSGRRARPLESGRSLFRVYPYSARGKRNREEILRTSVSFHIDPLPAGRRENNAAA